jgi:prepilin-type N-terminal cleavage/methylation domain-containing protein
MRTTRKRNRQGFTLVELLTVIAIIGILAAVLVPGVQAAMKLARKNAASGNVRQIALSYRIFATQGGKSRSIQEGSNPKNGQASTPAQYAEVLARYADLRSGEIWYIDSDDKLSAQTIPPNVLSQGDDGNNLLQSVSPISWAVVVGASKNLTDQYPLIWTRGLDTSGTWKEDSPWRREGGHIAFGDAHVRWYDNLNLDGNRLTNLTNGNETSSYQEAIGESARVKEDT